jgi:hypothetical protein
MLRKSLVLVFIRFRVMARHHDQWVSWLHLPII